MKLRIHLIKANRQTYNDKVVGREGNSPNNLLRSQSDLLSGKGCYKAITTRR